MVRKAFATTERVYPFLAYNAITGYWVRVDGRADYREPVEMSDKQEDNAVDDWHKTRNDQIVGAVLAESEQIQSRKAHIKRERRKGLIITALLVVGVIIVWGAVFASALAVR